MLEALPAAASSREEEPEAYRYRGGAFYMTTAEAADFYWMVVFVPSAVLFGASFTYLLAGESHNLLPRGTNVIFPLELYVVY